MNEKKVKKKEKEEGRGRKKMERGGKGTIRKSNRRKGEL